jgi:hypothetical protein
MALIKGFYGFYDLFSKIHPNRGEVKREVETHSVFVRFDKFDRQTEKRIRNKKYLSYL